MMSSDGVEREDVGTDWGGVCEGGKATDLYLLVD